MLELEPMLEDPLLIPEFKALVFMGRLVFEAELVFKTLVAEFVSEFVPSALFAVFIAVFVLKPLLKPVFAAIPFVFIFKAAPFVDMLFEFTFTPLPMLGFIEPGLDKTVDG